MTEDFLPPIRRAIVQGDTRQACGVIKDLAVPKLGKDEILVRTIAVAINPTDHKMPANFPSPRAIIGCDFAGIIVAAGSDVRGNFSVQVGDRVAGGVHGSNPVDHTDGAFAEYVRTSADLIFLIPTTMSWEDAAAIGGTGHGSLCIVLWLVLSLPGTPEVPSKVPDFVLVYVSDVPYCSGATLTSEGREYSDRHNGTTAPESVRFYRVSYKPNDLPIQLWFSSNCNMLAS